MECLIFCAGDCAEETVAVGAHDLVIAADAGFRLCEQLRITPSIAIGDWDSLGAPPSGVEVVPLPVMKNDTDTLAALKYGMRLGFTRFRIYGGAGGERIDHTLANLQSLVYLAKHGCRGILYEKNSIITAITNEALHFPKTAQGTLSVFAADGPAIGVYERGLAYSLDNATVTADFPVGVSNSFTGVESSVEVKNGTLLVVLPRSLAEGIYEF